MLIAVDGIDGSGKGTIVDALVAALVERGTRIADLRRLMKETGRFPSPEDFSDAGAVVTTEPTYAWVGAVIRNELLRGTGYSPLTLAQAFGVDREIHYRRVVIPALASWKAVISERGISSSLAYQVAAGVPEEEVLAIPGNRLALEHAPRYLVFAAIDPETAMARLETREKKDGAHFERLPFLRKLAARYADPAFRKLFTDRGTRILDLSTEGTVEDTRRRVRETLLPLLG